MKGIIWYKDDWVKGFEQLEKIIENYQQMNISTKRFARSRFDSFAEFQNGDIWRTKRAGEQNRGQRCNVSYIERNIDYDTYECIISHCTTSFPYNAIRLWGEGNLHLTDAQLLPF